MRIATTAVAAMCFASVIAEGGTSDWSPLFLRELSHASPALAAAGFSGFTLAATLVRFRADRITARTSRRTVARTGATIAVAGLALAIAFPALPTALLGFALVGASVFTAAAPGKRIASKKPILIGAAVALTGDEAPFDAPPIQAFQLAANDVNAMAKTGALGTAFLITYMLTAPALGWLADRFSRWIIIGSAVVLWSVASGASVRRRPSAGG